MSAQGLDRFRHIAIEGPIGAGKSSLARRLAAHLGAELMLERADENPYLERFYADVPGYAFQTQVFFLFQRMRQVRELAQPGLLAPAVVSDFMLAKDALFARMNLSDEEYHLYQQMYAQVSAQLPQPDLVIWLQATPPTLIQRIKQRGIAMEQRIASDYLQKLCDAYADYFQSFDGAPLMVVNSENFNPVERDADFHALVNALTEFEGPRGMFDLRPLGPG
ncbi:deoxynucleoside kinase [Piscinibacter gummiphilus]|uniref:Deoxynucleoside kinase n=1 Tax=Piscinibacter gummiphilus TaxID=946333 RepID=A0ABZ0CUG6_9BURK|nr:deoxynucleoside kinase [Piscinibacter gummiphilus]WOB06776.1 deoxynucleoside kinase [Piscinibacter gummiphilus]